MPIYLAFFTRPNRFNVLDWQAALSIQPENDRARALLSGNRGGSVTSSPKMNVHTEVPLPSPQIERDVPLYVSFDCQKRNVLITENMSRKQAEFCVVVFRCL